VATDLGFVLTPLPYQSFGKYTAKAGAKIHNSEMTELEALKELLPRRLIKLFRARAEAYFAENNLLEEYDKDGLWRYDTRTPAPPASAAAAPPAAAQGRLLSISPFCARLSFIFFFF
jgi:hypothetical protein